MSRIRRHLTFANVASAIALFIAISGGTAVALSGTNTVFSDDIVNGEVKQLDLAKAENWHEVSQPFGDTYSCVFGDNQCRFVNWSRDAVHNTVAFYRDPYGVVRLKGVVCTHAIPSGGSGCSIQGESFDSSVRIFTLPQGYRSAKWTELPTSSHGQFARIEIRPDGTVAADGSPGWQSDDLYLDGISFRCGPRGQNGCP
jgi:hypothetical protein